MSNRAGFSIGGFGSPLSRLLNSRTAPAIFMATEATLFVEKVGAAASALEGETGCGHRSSTFAANQTGIFWFILRRNLEI
ncbi:hypothetical protein [Parasphingorhabdus sp.]|uniref:hypothetical protein n=1 Tax=Parasphingorhabdus sp. TaxID=2709688 RepID=UPI0032658BA7